MNADLILYSYIYELYSYYNGIPYDLDKFSFVYNRLLHYVSDIFLVSDRGPVLCVQSNQLYNVLDSYSRSLEISLIAVKANAGRIIHETLQ